METDVHTRRMPHQEKGRDWGDAAKSGNVRLLVNLQKLRERHGKDCPSQPLE